MTTRLTLGIACGGLIAFALVGGACSDGSDDTSQSSAELRGGVRADGGLPPGLVKKPDGGVKDDDDDQDESADSDAASDEDSESDEDNDAASDEDSASDEDADGGSDESADRPQRDGGTKPSHGRGKK